jgi:hypothetical protein
MSTKGRGTWKFSANLLYDPEYVTKINKVLEICEVKHRDMTDKGLK